ncbi:50S ribosomal protein L10 [Dehalococcoides mccartyi]|nr:50S ribosomal protein L10 [Dehalococcoides mccartyi]
MVKKIRIKKKITVDELTDALAVAQSAVFTDYRGINTSELTTIRVKLREAGVGYRVLKNTLARRAADNTDHSNIKGAFEGPVAMAYSSNDVVAPARVLMDYISSSKSNLKVTGGYLSNKLISVEEVAELAKLPSREVLISKILAGMQSPITGLAMVLNGPARGLAIVLQARIKQLEG